MTIALSLLVHLAALEALDDPSGVEVDREGDAAAVKAAEQKAAQLAAQARQPGADFAAIAREFDAASEAQFVRVPAAEALQRFYGLAEKPLSVDDIQLGLIELATQHRPTAAPG